MSVKKVYRKSNGKREVTKLISVRLPESIINEFRAKNLNLSLAISVLLRGYLYIQNNDDDCPCFGSSYFDARHVYVDVYFKD